ncbi:hypothetical protein QCA50_008089 [Cerrena zonata]|uniref:Uncharacterized protein n=1 Tax=Cerrena zonata TaxID=2478898 RepID=A0AAW0G5B8_9APHY
MASDNSMPTQHHTNVGVIVGATVGGIVFIVIILVTAILVMRRQRGHTHGGMAYDRGHMSFNGTHESAIYSTASHTITPFTQGSPATYSSVYSSPPASVPSRIPNASEQESIPELVDRLNQAVAAQPTFNAPPEYATVAGNQAPSRPTVTITGKRRS